MHVVVNGSFIVNCDTDSNKINNKTTKTRCNCMEAAVSKIV